jgi:caffeoyl-CoA O-methyltransferase
MRHPSEALSYIRSLFAPESPATQKARELLETHAPEIAGISVGAEEGKLLQLLIRMNGVRRVVEIGSLAGYSGLWMAEALPKDGEIHFIEKDSRHAALIESSVASRQSPVKITLHTGTALDILPTLTGPFDMVFIDADKANYPHYLDWAEENIRPGGLIVGDNTLLFGHVFKKTLGSDARIQPASGRSHSLPLRAPPHGRGDDGGDKVMSG